jgi:pimeloyl-ACP methyl ester carboxylesterase
MVSSPNAYWLTFFLRREINVMCWNYRTYGHSKKPRRCCLWYCDSLNPSNIRKDSEKVLDFLKQKLKVKGYIGVYGRSLGGIASCHLAKKFPKQISALIVDRTFCELDVSSERRLYGSWTRFLYRFVSFNWRAKNDKNYMDAINCFKITTCDPRDEVIDTFSALPTGVAEKVARFSY